MQYIFVLGTRLPHGEIPITLSISNFTDGTDAKEISQDFLGCRLQGQIYKKFAL
jgi:hypothetical protein